MRTQIRELLAGGPVLTDGAWGTQLQSLGLEIGECPDAWNLSHPDRVERVARAYVEAGSRVILTNTFGGNRIRLAGHGLAERAADINRAGVEISRRAAAGRARVFASLGPSGRMLAAGETSEAELREAFGEQVRALAAGGADAIVVETMSDLDEARIAVEAVRASDLPVVACMVFDAGKDRDRTMTGVTPERAAEGLAAAGADVIGANCGRGPAGFESLCRRFRAAADRPLWIKPNAGLPERQAGRPVYRVTPDGFAAQAAALVGAGASFIGGCCGTSPEFIRALAVALRVQGPQSTVAGRTRSAGMSRSGDER